MGGGGCMGGGLWGTGGRGLEINKIKSKNPKTYSRFIIIFLGLVSLYYYLPMLICTF